jgi:aminocarboxymuconate-semialdehyde decarboxylase
MHEESSYYGPTAARQTGRLGREIRPFSITIDMHSHVLVAEADAYVKPHLDLSTMPLSHFATPNTQALNRKQEADRRPQLTDPEARLADMDATGVDMQIVMPPPSQCYYTVPPEIGIKAARMVNDGIAEFVSRRPDRFAALGTVPMQNGAAAAEELECCISRRGFKGVEILTNVAGIELSDPTYNGFWTKAEALGAVVLIHPNGFTEAKRLSRFNFNNLIGNPLDTAIALHYLIFDGVMERHPNLKIIAVHGGGYLAAYSGRIDHAWGARTDCRNQSLPPTTYLKRIFFDSVVFTPHQLQALVRVFGADHVLMGSDYPYDMGDSDPIGHLASLDTLDSSDLAAIAGGNAKKLYSLEAVGNRIRDQETRQGF